MKRLAPLAVGFAAGILAGFVTAYALQQPLNALQLLILSAISLVILLRHVRRTGVVNPSR